MTSSAGVLSYNAPVSLNVFLGIVLAFPLGIVTALVESIYVFGSILPISALFALVCPIVIPLITVSGLVLVNWFLVRSVLYSLIRAWKMLATFTKANMHTSHTVHVLLHAHEVVYMGIYGVVVIFGGTPATVGSRAASGPPCPLTRQPRARLFIRNFPISTMPTFPLTPPYSDPSYTPRSPTLSESTNMSHSLQTPVDGPTGTSLGRLSDLLNDLKDEELSVVMSYVEILKRGRSGLSAE